MGPLCFSCSQHNPGPQQSWKGSNTPSSCRNGKRPGFSCCAVFVLFLFLFCYLRDPWKRRRRALRAAGSPQRAIPAQCPHGHTQGSKARRDTETQLSGSSPKDSFELSFRWTTTRADTAAPRSLGPNAQRINFKLLPWGAGSVLLASWACPLITQQI